MEKSAKKNSFMKTKTKKELSTTTIMMMTDRRRQPNHQQAGNNLLIIITPISTHTHKHTQPNKFSLD